MSRAVQFELRLARRMSRLGTETAFEVLNRARELDEIMEREQIGDMVIETDGKGPADVGREVLVRVGWRNG